MAEKTITNSEIPTSPRRLSNYSYSTFAINSTPVPDGIDTTLDSITQTLTLGSTLALSSGVFSNNTSTPLLVLVNTTVNRLTNSTSSTRVWLEFTTSGSTSIFSITRGNAHNTIPANLYMLPGDSFTIRANQFGDTTPPLFDGNMTILLLNSLF